MLTRRRFVALIGAAGLGGLGWRLRSEETPFPAACVTRSWRLPGPAGWAGKRILFVSDVHYGNYFGPTEAAALNALVRRERPDLVAMGGDLAHTPATDLGGFFARWSPGCPTIFAPGNHDQAPGREGAVLAQARAAGLTVLCNAREAWNGLSLVGFPSALRARQELSLLQAPGLKVVLGHEPDVWDNYRQPDLIQLAGHTHGGQIRLRNRPLHLPTLGRKYPLGQYATGRNNFLFVSAGLGCVDVDVRLNCPPEIVTIELV